MNQVDMKKIKIINKCLLGALFISIPELLMASNGSNVIGFGHESLGLAGADIGYIRDTSAVSVNPAGLTHIEDNRLDLHAGFTNAGSIRHSDMFGNDETQSNSPIPFGGGAAAFRFNDKLVMGVGLLAQGGSGVEYKNLNTAFNIIYLLVALKILFLKLNLQSFLSIILNEFILLNLSITTICDKLSDIEP